MGFFTDPKKAALQDSIERLEKQLAKAQDKTQIGIELETAKQELADQKIKLSQQQEAHDRKIRETEHKVGLQKEKAEQDQKAAITEAKLTVREENIEAQQKIRDDQNDFIRSEMEKRSESVEKVLEQVLERLPKHNINDHHFSGGNPTETQAQIASGDVK